MGEVKMFTSNVMRGTLDHGNEEPRKCRGKVTEMRALSKRTGY